MVIKQISQLKMQKNDNFQKILINSVIVRIYSLWPQLDHQKSHLMQEKQIEGLDLDYLWQYMKHIFPMSHISTLLDVIIYEAYICLHVPIYMSHISSYFDILSATMEKQIDCYIHRSHEWIPNGMNIWTYEHMNIVIYTVSGYQMAWT